METHHWQETLRAVISDQQKRQRLADELNVNPVVLLRWAAGETRPPQERLEPLLKALPTYEE